MIAGKVLVGLTWLFCLGSLFFAPPGSWAGVYGPRILGFLVVAHAIECVVFLPKLRKLPGSLGHHLVQTMLFGILHLRSVEASAG